MKKIHFIVVLLLINSIAFSQKKAIEHKELNDDVSYNPITKNIADSLNLTLITSSAFDWTDKRNNCEDRANAISILLSKWGISNAKAWCFAGKNAKYKGSKGTLKGWSYHVAACVFVKSGSSIDTLVIDPLTSMTLLRIDDWAESISNSPKNIFFITTNDKYQQKNISLNPEWKLSADNYERTIKGLTRYNDFSSRQKRKTRKYYENRIVEVTQSFFKLYYCEPNYLNQ